MGILQATSHDMTKSKLKTHVRNVAFQQLLQLQKSHKKVKIIVYDDFKVQPYLQSERITQKEKDMLTALRSHSVRGIKQNFPLFFYTLFCPLNCESEVAKKLDTQSHILVCKSLSDGVELDLSDIYSEN